MLISLIACSSVRPAENAGPRTDASADAPPPIVIYVVRRSWHIDVGFSAADLEPPLASVRAELPDAHYLLFGFGDKHYLLSHGQSFGRLLGAVWPGEGLVLLTGLEATPEEAFGAKEVTRLKVTVTQAHELEAFVWQTLVTKDGAAKVLAPGPYSGSLYYETPQRYSGLHTCNTWAAEALRAGGLPVRSSGVVFSGQLWRQVRRINALKKEDAPPIGDASFQ
jgi:hypothetical protein